MMMLLLLSADGRANRRQRDDGYIQFNPVNCGTMNVCFIKSAPKTILFAIHNRGGGGGGGLAYPL